MKLLQKIQNLPESQKKIIFWLLLILLGSLLLLFWGKSIGKKVGQANIKSFIEQLNFPKIGVEKINELPKVPEQALDDIQKTLEELQQEQNKVQ